MIARPKSRRPGLCQEERAFPDIASVAMALQPSYPVYCLRPQVLESTARRFIALFPGSVLYAVKCNPHRLVLDALYNAGIDQFDVASLPEIAQIAESWGDAVCHFMHPVKSRAAIASAYKVYGVRSFAVDHADELQKVIEETEGGADVTVTVRLETPPVEGVLFHLASKFGASVEEAAAIVKQAERRGLATGLSFHVGSQCRNPAAYRLGLERVGAVIAASGVVPRIVDVGGGFPADYAGPEAPALETFAETITAGLREIGIGPEVEVLAEPGRALVAAGCSLLTQVQLRKGHRLYINDGIYGSLSEFHRGELQPPVRLIRLGGGVSARLADFALGGPTCDSEDVLRGSYALPEDVREGDWIELDGIGAYSNALASHFNGFHPDTFVEVYDEPPARRP